jgi:hypothetical protein
MIVEAPRCAQAWRVIMDTAVETGLDALAIEFAGSDARLIATAGVDARAGRRRLPAGGGSRPGA